MFNVNTFCLCTLRQLHFSPITLGWLLSGYGVATMFSEVPHSSPFPHPPSPQSGRVCSQGVVVRLIVPRIGETNSIRIGLVSFAAQCAVVAFSTSSTSIFASILFSMLSNLVYPSISSLVSKVLRCLATRIANVTNAFYLAGSGGGRARGGPWGAQWHQGSDRGLWSAQLRPANGAL